MRLPARPFALAAVFGLALLCSACSSDNKGKIEGKWKFTEMPGMDAQAKQGLDMMDKLGIYLYMEFKPDNTLTLGLGSDKPEAMEFFKGLAKGQQTTWTAKYKLLTGDGVEVYDIPKEMQEQGGGPFAKKDRARSQVKIDGDTMTITDEDGKTGKLARIK
jgi:hypothetical protein